MTIHLWHVTLLFGVLLGAPLWFALGAVVGRYLALRRMTLSGKTLDVLGTTYGLSRRLHESDAAYRERMTRRAQS